jgi:hypothetical protein
MAKRSFRRRSRRSGRSRNSRMKTKGRRVQSRMKPRRRRSKRYRRLSKKQVGGVVTVPSLCAELKAQFGAFPNAPFLTTIKGKPWKLFSQVGTTSAHTFLIAAREGQGLGTDDRDEYDTLCKTPSVRLGGDPTDEIKCVHFHLIEEGSAAQYKISLACRTWMGTETRNVYACHPGAPVAGGAPRLYDFDQPQSGKETIKVHQLLSTNKVYFTTGTDPDFRMPQDTSATRSAATIVNELKMVLVNAVERCEKVSLAYATERALTAEDLAAKSFKPEMFAGGPTDEELDRQRQEMEEQLAGLTLEVKEADEVEKNQLGLDYRGGPVLARELSDPTPRTQELMKVLEAKERLKTLETDKKEAEGYLDDDEEEELAELKRFLAAAVPEAGDAAAAPAAVAQDPHESHEFSALLVGTHKQNTKILQAVNETLAAHEDLEAENFYSLEEAIPTADFQTFYRHLDKKKILGKKFAYLSDLAKELLGIDI